MQITDQYVAKLNEYFKPGKNLSAEQYGEILEHFHEHERSVLLLHICEGRSLTEISAIRDSNVMRIQQIFSKADRLMKFRIQNAGRKNVSDLLDESDDDKPMILNIHGYHGSPKNSAYRALDALGCEVIAPALDYDNTSPDRIINDLKYILADKRPDITVGTSLGGFYAAVISAQCDHPVMLVNPFLMSFLTFDGDVRPHKDIKALIGLFGCLSQIDISNVSCIVGDNDELLGDHKFTEELLGNARFRRIPGGGHSGATLPLKEYFGEMLYNYTDTLTRKELMGE